MTTVFINKTHVLVDNRASNIVFKHDNAVKYTINEELKVITAGAGKAAHVDWLNTVWLLDNNAPIPPNLPTGTSTILIAGPTSTRDVTLSVPRSIPGRPPLPPRITDHDAMPLGVAFAIEGSGGFFAAGGWLATGTMEGAARAAAICDPYTSNEFMLIDRESLVAVPLIITDLTMRG